MKKLLSIIPTGKYVVLSKVGSTLEPSMDKDEKKEQDDQKKTEIVEKQNSAITKVSEMLTGLNELNQTVFSDSKPEIRELAMSITEKVNSLIQFLSDHVAPGEKDDQSKAHEAEQSQKELQKEVAVEE